MVDDQSLWYQLGYALQTARNAAGRPPRRRLPGAAEIRRRLAATGPEEDRRPRSPGGPPDAGAPPGDALDALLLAAGGTLATRLLNLWPERSKPGVVGLLRGAGSGAGAALLGLLARRFLAGGGSPPRLDDDTAEALLSGAGRGILYAGIVAPRVPGPSLLRGVLYGALEYGVSPWGGLSRILGSHSPHHRVPVLGPLLEPEAEGGDASWREHLLFGVALAVLYGAATPPREARGEE